MPWDLLSLLGVLLVLVLVLAGCYMVTRWAGTGLAGGGFGSTGQQRRIDSQDFLGIYIDRGLVKTVFGSSGRTRLWYLR